MSSQSKSASDIYTRPALRDRLKKTILASARGGKANQWSARKAQLLAAAYKKEGGGYKKSTKRSGAQKHIVKWTKESWTNADGKPAKRKGGTTRYLPEKAWSKLTPGEKKSTIRKKQAGSRKGAQFVANTRAAAKARKSSVSR